MSSLIQKLGSKFLTDDLFYFYSHNFNYDCITFTVVSLWLFFCFFLKKMFSFNLMTFFLKWKPVNLLILSIWFQCLCVNSFISLFILLSILLSILLVIFVAYFVSLWLSFCFEKIELDKPRDLIGMDRRK